MGTLKTTPGKSLKQLEYNYPAYIMLRGPNLVLKKRLRPLFSTYFGKKGLISKILLRSMLAARHFFIFFLRKMAVNVLCLAHFEPVKVSKTSQLSTVISQNF